MILLLIEFLLADFISQELVYLHLQNCALYLQQLHLLEQLHLLNLIRALTSAVQLNLCVPLIVLHLFGI